MGLFKPSDPEKQAKADLAKATAKRDDLDRRLNLARTRVVECNNTVRMPARDAALDDELGAAEAELIAAEKRVASLATELDDVQKEVADLERQIAKMLDEQVRASTAAEIAEWLNQWDEAAKLFDEGCRAVEKISALTGPTIMDVYMTQSLAQMSREQLPRIVEVIKLLLTQHRKGVLAGVGRPMLAQPPQPAPKLQIVPPPEPMTTVFVVKNIKYIDAQGMIVCHGLNRRADLSARIAELALAAGAATTLADKKRIQTFEGSSGMLEPLSENCMWIGPAGKEAAPKFIRPGGTPTMHCRGYDDRHHDHKRAWAWRPWVVRRVKQIIGPRGYG